MLIQLRDRGGKLLVKDILDIDFDMFVKEAEKKGYLVVVNPAYTLAETFDSQEEAEDAMIGLANARNDLENELRNL